MSPDDKNTHEFMEARCECGKLLFKRTSRGFEFKCNRCKRIHFIPFDRIGTEYQSICPVLDNPAARDHESSALKMKGEEKKS